MKISVIVLTWNGKAYVVKCLEALLAQDCPAFEVLVVDKGSVDGTPELVAERFPNIRLIRNLRNLGFAAGNNIGLRAAMGDILVLLNQDTEVHSGFLTALAAAFDEPGVGLAGCKLLYPDGTIQHASGFLYGPRGETEHIGRSLPDDGRFDERAEPEFVTAAALGISRNCLARIGLLDEAFDPAYYEDVDWCYRTRAAGFRVVYTPEAVVTHHESATADRTSHQHKMNLNHGRVRFLLKHWPMDRLLEEFGPAEARWVAAMPRITELMAARGAYLRVLLDLPRIAAFRSSSRTETEALAHLLADLRAAALASLQTLYETQALAPPASELPPIPEPVANGMEKQAPSEQPAMDRASGQSRLGARLRRLWAALRHLDVLPDVVRHLQEHDRTIARQGQVQTQQGELIGQVSRRVDILDAHSAKQGDVLSGLARDVAQNIRELSAIAEELASVEASNDEEQAHG